MKNSLVLIAFCMLVAVGLVACGGGGGGSCTGCADTMTVAVSGSAPITYTEGPYNSFGYLDPSLSSFVTPSGNTSVSLCSGVTPSGTSATCDTLISISIKGNTPQSYPTGTTGTPTQISYRTNNQTYSSVSSSTTGTITLSSVGNNVGEKITGTFDAMVTNMSNSSDTLGISGTFSVKRDF
jgi:hypothetical protein